MLGISVLLIGGDQFYGTLMTGDEVLMDEANQTVSMRVALVMEVQTLGFLDDVERLIVGIVPKNQLFQIKHCPFVRYLLPDLHL